MQDRVGGKMVELKAIKVKESLEKRMNWEPQTSKKMGEEDDALTGVGFKDTDKSGGTRQSLGHGRVGGGHLSRRQVSGVPECDDVILSNDRGPTYRPLVLADFWLSPAAFWLPTVAFLPPFEAFTTAVEAPSLAISRTGKGGAGCFLDSGSSSTGG